MNTIDPNRLFDGTPKSKMGRLLGSAKRCHAVALTISATIVGTILWVVANGDWFAADTQHSRRQIQDSISLVSEANMWRRQYSDMIQQSRAHESTIQAIRNWLPATIDWPATKTQLSELAKTNDLQVMQLDRDNKESLGVRVAIVEVNCVLYGQYEDVCRFLDTLPQLENPIWCDSVRVAADEVANANSDSDSIKRCHATITLRLPYAGAGTVAEKLLVLEGNHAS